MPGRARKSWQEKWDAVEHGTTYGMSQRCYLLNPDGKVCPACSKVRADYITQWRATNDQSPKTKGREVARTRALRRLSHLHPTDFQKLFTEELAKAVIKRGKPGRKRS